MKRAMIGFAAAFVCAFAVPAYAAGLDVEARWTAAMQSARWTGSMLSSNAETLPHGHFYTEPYVYEVISSGNHTLGSSGFYQYGLSDSFTIGLDPSFALGTKSPNRALAIGDFKILSQLRLTHFTPKHRVPTVAIMFNAVLPTGKFDRLAPEKEGHGSGSFASEIGVNVQDYFLLGNGRLLRVRLNFLKSLPYGAHVSDRSVYGTAAGFRGHVRPGSTTTMLGAVEYSITREWVVAFDVIRTSTAATRLEGGYGSGPTVKQTFPKSWSVGFAPAVEYNWDDRTGVLLGVWVSPKGRNSQSSLVPAIAISRFR